METNHTKPMSKAVLNILDSLKKNGITPFKGTDEFYLSKDKALQERVYAEFGIGLNDFGIKLITCKPSNEFIIISLNGGFSHFVNTITGMQSPGYVIFYGDGTCDLHIAPTVSTGNRIDFLENCRHELTHCIHNHLIPNHSELFTEACAYEQSYHTFLQAGMIDKAEEIKQLTQKFGYNNEYPPEYELQWNIFKYGLLCQKLNRKQITVKGFITI